MIYADWMSYIKDDALITKIAIPGAHNAGSMGMNKFACCQEGSFFTQFLYGIRHYCIRLNTKKDGTIVLAHGLSSGMDLEDVLRDFRRMLEYNGTEFFIFDIREYYDQKVGPVTLKYKADPARMDELLAKYIEPEKYAFTDFDDISKVTMGDIRASGKRYVLINEAKAYKGSAPCECIFPWDKKVFGSAPEVFARETVRIFDENETDGFYWFQTQMTPNFGTKVGIKTPRRLDDMLRPYFGEIIGDIAGDPERLAKVNIVAGDFMTKDYMKVRAILELNLAKGVVKDELREEYKEGLYR